MAVYSVINGQIQAGVLYIVIGTKSVTYNFITYSIGQNFRGVKGVKTFTYSGSGTEEVNEVLELASTGIEFIQDATTQPFPNNATVLKGLVIEYELTEAEKIVQETTRIKGFALELLDYPFYIFEITETRL